MARARVRLVLAVAGLATCWGCGDDDGGTNSNQNSNQTGGMSITDYCTAQAALIQDWCDYLDQCCTAADRASSNFIAPYCSWGPDDPQGCVDTVNDRVAAGAIQWNGNRAQACLDAQASYIQAPPATCSGLNTATVQEQTRDQPARLQIAACKEMYVGQRNQGDECDYEMDCAAGLACRGTSSPYTCQPVSGQFGACILQTSCEPGLLCIDEMCDTLQGWGDDCTSSSDCQEGLKCGTSTCVNPIPLYGDCTDGMFDCDVGLACEYASNTCVTYGAPGSNCSNDYECTGRCEGSTCTTMCGGTWY